MVTDIANFYRGVVGDFALDAERPLLNIGDAQLRIESPQSVVGIETEVTLVGYCRVECWDAQRQSRRRKYTQWRVGAHGLDQSGVGCSHTQRIAHNGKPILEVADRITGADRAFSRWSEEPAHRAFIEVGRVGDADERGKIVPVIPVEFFACFPIDEFKCCGRLTGKRPGLEEVVGTGNAE